MVDQEVEINEEVSDTGHTPKSTRTRNTPCSKVSTASNEDKYFLHSSKSRVKHEIVHDLDTSVEGDIDEGQPIIGEEYSDTEYIPKSTQTRKRTAFKVTTPSLKRAHHYTPMSSISKVKIGPGGQFTCKTSNLSPSKDAAALQMCREKDNTFTCDFAFAGCHSRLSNKKDWKRHILTQHLRLSNWVCELDACSKVYFISPGSKIASTVTKGAVFCRKDQFTRHIRRIHAPHHIKNTDRNNEWEKYVRGLEASCLKVHRQPPAKLRCSIDSCDNVFEGVNCLDNRMEHVGRHFQKAHQDGSKIRLEQDELLVSWALREGIIQANPMGIGYRVVTQRWESVGDKKSHLHNNIKGELTLQHPIVNETSAQYDINIENRVWATENGHMIGSKHTNPKESDSIDDRKTDSGYHTRLGTDTTSLVSYDSIEPLPSLSLNVLHDLITNFTKVLLENPYVSDWARAAANLIPSHTMEMKVAGLLENFTKELLPLANITQDSKNKTEACLFIRRNKHRIATCFRKRAGTTTTADLINRLKSLSVEITLEEKMDNWATSGMVCKDTNEETDDDESDLLIEFSDAKEFLISSSPFQHLLERLQALYYDRNGKLSTVRNLMTGNLDLSPRDLDLAAIFEMHWNLPNFMKTQYNFDKSVKLESVITISGSALYCQATTSAEYLKQNWPGHGLEMLGILQAALDSPKLAAKGIMLIFFPNRILDIYEST